MSQEKADLEAILAQLPRRRRTPVSTYRLQFHKGFGFKDAQRILPYLAALGVTDCYASPILKARPGSPHGYDICDHNALNPELGTEQDFESFVQSLEAHHMGLILDFVPNHMGVDPETNPWWHDVLENGQCSAYAQYFDIHWNSIMPELKGKVLLPILGGQYGDVLERGEMRLQFNGQVFTLHYFEHRLPVDPQQYSRILRWDLGSLEKMLTQGAPAYQEYLSIQTALDHLPLNTEPGPARIAERRREKAIAVERLTRLAESEPAIRAHIERAVTAFNGEPGQHQSFNPLHALLEAQPYRLAYWKTAFHEINYRRFFDINSLAGLRVENDPVFPQTHKLVMRLIAEGRVTGLRIDHPDGLYDPALYFESLQDMFLQEWVKHVKRRWGYTESMAGHWSAEQQQIVRDWRVAERKKDPKGLAARPLYIVAEKILSHGEALDPHWVIDGTSGYDFLNDVNGLFVATGHAARIQSVYGRFAGKRIPFEKVVYLGKKLIMSTSLASELNVLAYSLHAIAEQDRRFRDFTWDSLRDALKEVIACFPVYRTYINASRAGASDRAIIERAVQEAKRRNTSVEPSTFDFLYAVLTPENVGKVAAEVFHRQLGFTMKFQQYTGPVQAKGLEDTAFYRYNAQVSLNEVGGDPARFGTSVADFHKANTLRHVEWPFTMLATSTHDTKRGEDARARLDVISEIPEEWDEELTRWAEINATGRIPVNGEAAPDRNDEYLFYQALLGAWSEESLRDRETFIARMREYMLKAIREAKLHTSWVAPNEAYEKAVGEFIGKVLADGENAFLHAFTSFARRISHLGMLNSLSQVILKAAAPGVPDFYQGTELWDLSLVDPDNRREVDFSRREEALEEVMPLVHNTLAFLERRKSPARVRVGPGAYEREDEDGVRLQHEPVRHADLLRQWEDGRVKLFVTACALRFRQRHPEIFLEGDYTPLDVTGDKAEHVVAFARTQGNKVLLAVAPRLPVALLQGEGRMPVGEAVWGNTRIRLPGKTAAPMFRSICASEDVLCSDVDGCSTLRLSELLSTCPVGLFYADLDK